MGFYDFYQSLNLYLISLKNASLNCLPIGSLIWPISISWEVKAVILFFTGGLLSFSTNEINSTTESEIIGGAYLTFTDKFDGTVTYKDLNRMSEIDVAGCVKDSKIFQFN